MRNVTKTLKIHSEIDAIHSILSAIRVSGIFRPLSFHLFYSLAEDENAKKIESNFTGQCFKNTKSTQFERRVIKRHLPLSQFSSRLLSLSFLSREAHSQTHTPLAQVSVAQRLKRRLIAANIHPQTHKRKRTSQTDGIPFGKISFIPFSKWFDSHLSLLFSLLLSMLLPLLASLFPACGG